MIPQSKYVSMRICVLLELISLYVQRGYGAHFPRALAGCLSECGRDFVASLLTSDIAKRMTAKEALAHPWLTCTAVNDNNNNEHKEEIDLTALKCAGWATSNKFKYAISALFQEQFTKVRPKHFENLKRIFSELDKNNDGVISYQEFEAGMLSSGIDKNKTAKMFKELAIGNEQGINFKSLLNAAVHDYLVESDVRLYEAFRELDVTDCGHINTNVLKNAIRKLGMYDEEQIDFVLQIIDDVDLDDDGTIDYEEFLRALHPDFNEAPNWIYSDEEAKDNNSSEHSDDYNENDMREVNISPSVEEFNSDGIVKEGYMKKEGKYVKSWKNRWFVLTNNGKMSYYHDKKSQYPIGTFSCRNLTKLSNKSWNKKTFGLKVYTPHRNWKLLLQNNEERAEWYAAIKSVSKLKSTQH